MEKFTQLTKNLHDRRSRRSRQIPSLPTSKYENETMAHITDPPAEGYIREAKFRGQIRHSGEKDKGTHGEGWHRASGHLVVLPSGGSSPSPSLPLSPSSSAKRIVKGGRASSSSRSSDTVEKRRTFLGCQQVD